MIIDESDGDLDSFERAVELGYRGVSTKNCKGLFKALANAALARRLSGERGVPFLITAEDLMNLPVVPLHQDLAHVAALGLDHAERNGHHYVRGLDHLSPPERERVLGEHEGLYRRSKESGFLHVDGGSDRRALPAALPRPGRRERLRSRRHGPPRGLALRESAMTAPLTPGAEAVARLQEMLRFDTTNPPGNELPLVRHLAAQLAAEGLEPQVLEAGPERASLAVRLRGDGSERPLLMMSHLDVVPAEPERWSHPPFAGEIAGGVLYGRGSIDSKLTAAVHLQALLMCHRNKLPLKRDVVVIAAADEELGGVNGMGWIADNHPEWLDAEYGINEAGGFAVLVDGQPIYTCQVAEKGGADADLIARGRPGHSSVPHDDNPIVHLGAAQTRLGGKLPHRVTPAVAAFFEAAARAVRPEVGGCCAICSTRQRADQALRELPVEPPVRGMFDAMLRNTCAPTLLEAGMKRNVIPSEAAVRLSGRPLPGVTEEEFAAEVRDLAGRE